MTLIIGNGEVGIALYNVLKDYYDTRITGKTHLKVKGIEMLHICFPYSDKFKSEVKRYQKLYKPKYTIIHSTTPVGTSTKLKATHSPIIGVHPYLTESIKTFVKFVGGINASDIAEYFRLAGLKVQICDKSETTELAKILSTTNRGIEVEIAKETKRLCSKYKVPYSEVYMLWTRYHNEGYRKLGDPDHVRAILQPIMKKLGGHCIASNAKLLDSWLTNLIRELNK